MKVKTLLKLNPVDELRFYEKSDIGSHEYIDEYTPCKSPLGVDLNREVESFSTIIEGSCGEYENDWIAVILKEEEK